MFAHVHGVCMCVCPRPCAAVQATQAQVDGDKRTVEAGLRFLSAQRLDSCLHLAFQQWKLAQVNTAVRRRETQLMSERAQLLQELQVIVCGRFSLPARKGKAANA